MTRTDFDQNWPGLGQILGQIARRRRCPGPPVRTDGLRLAEARDVFRTLMAAIDGGYRRQLRRVLRAAVYGVQLRLLQKIYCLLSYSTTVTRLINLH